MLKTCSHCGASRAPQRSPLARAIGARTHADLVTTGAQIGGALGALKGRPGIVIGSTAGAVIGGLLSAQRQRSPKDEGHCPHCGQASAGQSAATSAAHPTDPPLAS
jgi:phage tail tape-measure protein